MFLINHELLKILNPFRLTKLREIQICIISWICHRRKENYMIIIY
nr:MAG TPA: hypothetical protein [Caudoviricetes sp.]